MFALTRSCVSRAFAALVITTNANLALALEDTPLPISAAVDSVGLEAYGPIAAISPDGSRAAYSVSIAHVHQLRMLSIKHATSDPLTKLTDDARAPAWSPDGKSLAFFMRSMDRPGNQFHLWLYRSGRLRQISATPAATRPPWMRPLWTRNGRLIIVALATPDATAMLEPQLAPSAEAVEVFRAFRDNTPEKLPSQLSPPSDGIGVIDVRSGKLRRLASGMIYAYQLDPSGQRIAVIIRPPRRNTDRFETTDQLQIIDLKTGASKTLFDAVSSAYAQITWSPDGRYVGWVQDYPPDVGTAYLASVDGTLRKIKSEPDAAFAAENYGGRPILWDASSRRFFAIADGHLRVGSADELVARAVTRGGEWKIGELIPGAIQGTAASGDGYRSIVASVFNSETLEEGFGSIDLASGELSVRMKTDGHLASIVNKPAVLPDNRVLYPAEAADQPGALWLSDLDFHSSAIMTPLNPQLPDRVFGTSRLVTWKNSRGDVLRGVMLVPAGCQPGQGRRCPLIVNIYAEPGAGHRRGLFGASDDGSGQIYATRGYIVFSPDTRLRMGSPAADLVDDVGTGLDFILRQGIVDPTRIGVEGESYGGYNAVVLAARDKRRYRAAASTAGFSELATATYGNPGKGSMQSGWAEGPQGRMSGHPWQSPELRRTYIDNSPFWELDAVEKTPLLLLHGAKDDTVPPFASFMTFNALKRLHRQVELVIYRDEGHGFQQRPNRIDVAARKLAWFDEHLDLARDDRGRLLFDGDRPRSRNGGPPLSLADFTKNN